MLTTESDMTIHTPAFLHSEHTNTKDMRKKDSSQLSAKVVCPPTNADWSYNLAENANHCSPCSTTRATTVQWQSAAHGQRASNHKHSALDTRYHGLGAVGRRSKARRPPRGTGLRRTLLSGNMPAYCCFTPKQNFKVATTLEPCYTRIAPQQNPPQTAACLNPRHSLSRANTSQRSLDGDRALNS